MLMFIVYFDYVSIIPGSRTIPFLLLAISRVLRYFDNGKWKKIQQPKTKKTK